MTTQNGALALALSSSTGVMSAAVGRIGSADPLAATTVTTDRRHAEEISPLVQKLMADSGITLGDLELLVVDRGPGRFTGLRVGLATIKTFAFALGIPVVGLTSLEILAAVARARLETAADGPGLVSKPDCPSPVTAVIDARRSEVFQQVFAVDLEPVGRAAVGPAAVQAAQARGVVVGDGADRYRAEYETAGIADTGDVADAVLVPGVDVDASVMLVVAAGRTATAGAEIEPLYLRDPDVNPNVKTRPRV